MLNETQRRAVESKPGPAIVLAGPGSGKTTVIISRIKYLIDYGIVEPERILAITFTKAAAKQMSERFEKKMGDCDISSLVTFGTIHSILYKILRAENQNIKCIKIATETDRLRIIKEILQRRGVKASDDNEYIRDVLNKVSLVKSNKRKLSLHKNEEDTSDYAELMQVINEYDDALQAEGTMDFDDIVIRCYELLSKNNQVRKKWNGIYRYILVDEFQDVDDIQYEALKLLAGECGIFAVGDDDQSIYGFRGADSGVMFRFTKEFKNAQIIKLDRNYRCPDKIVEAAHNVIANNGHRFKKKIVPVKTNSKSVEVRCFNNSDEQYSYIIDKIKQYEKKGIPLDEMAILVRNNSVMDILENYFGNEKISTKSRHKKSLYSNSIAIDINAYIEAAISKLDVPIIENESLSRIINKPERFIGRQLIKIDGPTIYQIEKIYNNSKEISCNIKQLLFHLNMISKMTPYAAINYIEYGVGYDEYIATQSNEKHWNTDLVNKVIGKMKRDAVRFNNLHDWIRYCNEQIKDDCRVDVNNLKDSKTTGKCQGVNIITMHASKGLEYKVVFIPDAVQGIIPEARAIRERRIDEERRLFYVAMTRAAEQLHICAVDNVMGRKCDISQFVREMCLPLHF